MAESVKGIVDGDEIVLSFDEPPQVNQTIEIKGRKRTITRVIRNQFMNDPSTFSIEVE